VRGFGEREYHSIPYRSITPFSIETSLSSVTDWAPQVPLDLFRGRDDRTVPYLSATRTLQSMRARGAGNLVTLTDCVAQPAGHSQCVLPYWRFVVDRFGKDAKDL